MNIKWSYNNVIDSSETILGMVVSNLLALIMLIVLLPFISLTVIFTTTYSFLKSIALAMYEKLGGKK